MGVQKSKRSKARRNNKRSAWSKLNAVSAMTCPNCHEPKLPHHVCPSCGHYDGRVVGAEKVPATTAAQDDE